MEDKNRYITWFQVNKMWGRINLRWDNVNDDVNILVGVNGCGKTTLLNLIYDYYSGQKLKKNAVAESVEGNKISIPVSYIRSFDVSANTKKKTESVLLQELKYIINQNGEGTSFFDYRMKMLNYPEQSELIKKRIDCFFRLVNSLFEETGKEIMIDPTSNNLVFAINGTEKFLVVDGKRLDRYACRRLLLTSLPRIGGL